MLRPFDVVMIGVLIAGASWTFKVKHDAELAMERVREVERKIEREKNAIDLLRADWALLTSPQRLQELAEQYQDQLQLKDLEATQIVDELTLPPMRPPLALDPDDFADGEGAVDPDSLTGAVQSNEETGDSQ